MGTFEEENSIIEILESAGVSSDVNDKILLVVRSLCERNAKADAFRKAIKQSIMSGRSQFNDKVIESMFEPYQCWSTSLSFSIPLKHPIINDRFVKIEEPSMSFEDAVNKWLDSLAK